MTAAAGTPWTSCAVTLTDRTSPVFGRATAPRYLGLRGPGDRAGQTGYLWTFLVIDGLTFGRLPRRDPLPEVGDRLVGNLDLKRPDGDIRICNSNIKFHNLYPFTRAPKTISLMGCWSAIAARPSGRFPCSAGLVPASRSRSARSVAPVEARAGGPDRRLRTLISGRAASAPPGCEERRASSAAPSYRVKLPVSTMWSRPGAARDSTDAREPPGTRSCWHD